MWLTKPEDAYIIKGDGTLCGPYKSHFSGDTVFVTDIFADICEGDMISRKLPNGIDEIKQITKSTYYTGKLTRVGPHYQLKITSTLPSQGTNENTVITFNGPASNIQIGNENQMHLRNDIQNIIKAIDESPADP